MAIGKPGADSSVIVTTSIEGVSLIDLATELFGSAPVFWGRYFKSASGGGSAEYRHLKENQPLRAAGIRVLPIAQQTKRVAGTQSDGSSDAEDNVDDVLATFGVSYLAGQGGAIYLFLDVEGSPSLSKAYYMGWAQTVVAHSQNATGNQVTIWPCVYATQGDVATWSSVVGAVSAGAVCKGAWIARWRETGCFGPPDWNDALVSPGVALPCPILAWQYANDCHGGGGFDCSEVNPNIDLTEFLSHLVLPPATGGTS